MRDYVIFLSNDEKSIQMLKNFAEYIVKPEDDTLVVSDNICKEYWIAEFDNRYGDKVTRHAEAHNKTERQVLEEQFEIFESSGGWENTESFDGWTNYTPEEFLNKW